MTYTATGLGLVKVAATPAAGQYAVSQVGVYSFNSADAGASVLLAYTYMATSGTAPASGSGTATVTVTDATDSLTATSTISYTAVAATLVCSPTSFPLGVATAFTLTGTNTSWTNGTKPKVTGGTNACVSNFTQSGQTLTGTLNPGSATGTLTMGDTTDSATANVTAAANVINNIVWHGDSLTYGQNGSNPGTTSATRLAQVINALGPIWQARNYGNPGHTISQMISELTATVNGYYDATKQNNILVVQGGHNDIGGGGLTAAQVIANIGTYLQTALAAHPWKIIWSTQPPAQYPGAYPANFDSIRDTINAYMRLNWQSLGIAALSDFALDFRMGLDGCEYNSTYYSGTDFTQPNYSLPEVDTGDLMYLLAALLGMGGLRTIEKLNGVAAK